MSNQSKGKKAYFIGIAGAGMSAVASALKDDGWVVSGSDSNYYPPISNFLEKQNIPVHNGYDAENLPEDADLIVVGGGARMKPDNEENVEVRTAREKHLHRATFPEVLHDLSAGKHNVVVAGSFGKSTVTTLIAWCLEHAGKNPNYFIGALPIGMKKHGHLDKGDIFVLEGDEYPTSSLDDTPKFLYFRPRDVVLIAAEHDHVNVFPTINEYLKPYQELLSSVPKNGLIIACTDNANVPSLVEPYKKQTRTYGLNQKYKPNWSAQNISRGTTTGFELVHNDEKLLDLETTLLGEHNIQNIVGASALLLERELLTQQELRSAIKAFKGIRRRLDLKTEKSTVLAYEGFGSSYDKARAAMKAVKTHFPGRRIITLFEPYTFSWRNRETLYWYDDAFTESSALLLYQIAEIGANRHDQVTQKDIIKRLEKATVNVISIKSADHGIEMLERLLKPNDVLLILTSGHLDGLVERLPDFLERKFPKTT